MAAATTSIVSLTDAAWTDVTPTGILVVQCFVQQRALLCLSATNAGGTSLSAPALELGPGEKIQLNAGDLGGAYVLMRAPIDVAKVVVAR